MKKSVLFVILSLVIISCSKEPTFPVSNYSFGGGVLIVNEGNFRGVNGSLSFYSYDSSKITNDLFYTVNGRPLGDVPNSIITHADKAYIIVNNSGKIEVVNSSTLASVETITGLISPRYMTVINDNKAYVSSLYSDSVAIINLTTYAISGYINLRRTSEVITLAGNKAFVANWAGGKEVMVIDAVTDKLIDSISVGIEPESMVVDKQFMLWVLCDGGWDKQNNPELDVIDVFTNRVVKQYVFPTKEESPSCLKIDGSGQTLYYLDQGLKQMDISAGSLPQSTLVQELGAHFYKIAVNPINSDIFITDAVDFQQAGYVLLYKNNGLFVSKNKAGIIPGSMCFKLRIDTKPL
jgi:YVTN family beta-propeller protein